MSIQGRNENELHVGRYISVPQAIQLIHKPFDGNPTELREFIQNVESTYEVADPLDKWWTNYGPLRGSIRPAADFKIIV